MTEPTKKPGKKSLSLLKLISFSAAGVVIGFGLCTAGSSGFPNHTNFLLPLGLILFAGSAIGLVIGILWAISNVIYSAFK